VHEWSLAEGIYQAILEFAKNHDVKKVLEVEIKVGELMQLDLDLMKEAILMLAQGSVMEEAEIKLTVEKAAFSCEKCGHEWNFEVAKKEIEQRVSKDKLIKNDSGSLDLPLHYIPGLVYALATCPKCGSSNILVVRGRDIKIQKITVEK